MVKNRIHLFFKSKKNSCRNCCELLKYDKEINVQPVFLFGFPRSGTTTFQKILSDVLAYNTSFEPIGYNHAHWDKKSFLRINISFTGAPKKINLPLYFVGGMPLSTIHNIPNKELKFEYIELLKEYVIYLLDYYGHNVVIKEIRMISNIPTVAEICEKIKIKPVYIFLTCNPLITLYTYYRLGGLIESNDFAGLGVNEIYEYRRITYALLGMFNDILTIPCRNKFEKLVISVILDQQYMQFYAAGDPDYCFVADFGKVFPSLDAILKKFLLPQKEETKIKLKEVKIFEKDVLFLKYVKAKLSPDILLLIEKLYNYRLNTTKKLSFPQRSWFAFARQKLLD